MKQYGQYKLEILYTCVHLLDIAKITTLPITGDLSLNDMPGSEKKTHEHTFITYDGTLFSLLTLCLHFI